MIASTIIKSFCATVPEWLAKTGDLPWEITCSLEAKIEKHIDNLSSDYQIADRVAIHRSSTIEQGVTLKGPIIIGENSFVASNAYLRGGVFLGEDVKIGPGCEIKTSALLAHCTLAHFYFIGDSIIGKRTNIEAGAIIANHRNEEDGSTIRVNVRGKAIDTHCEKFGAIVGDGSKIGANAVIAPGSLINKSSIVQRLALIDQLNGTSTFA